MRTTRAILAWTFDHPETVCEQHERAAGVFLAAFHQDPRCSARSARSSPASMSGCAEDALPPGHAMAVMAACDGHLHGQLFDMYRQTPEER